MRSYDVSDRDLVVRVEDCLASSEQRTRGSKTTSCLRGETRFCSLIYAPRQREPGSPQPLRLSRMCHLAKSLARQMIHFRSTWLHSGTKMRLFGVRGGLIHSCTFASYFDLRETGALLSMMYSLVPLYFTLLSMQLFVLSFHLFFLQSQVKLSRGNK